MNENDYKSNLVKRDIKVIIKLIVEINKLEELDKYLNPTNFVLFSTNHEFSMINDFIKRVEFIIDEDMYSKCQVLVTTYYNNIYNRNIVHSKNSIVESRKELIIDLNRIVSEFEGLLKMINS